MVAGARTGGMLDRLQQGYSVSAGSMRCNAKWESQREKPRQHWVVSIECCEPYLHGTEGVVEDASRSIKRLGLESTSITFDVSPAAADVMEQQAIVSIAAVTSENVRALVPSLLLTTCTQSDASGSASSPNTETSLLHFAPRVPTTKIHTRVYIMIF